MQTHVGTLLANTEILPNTGIEYDFEDEGRSIQARAGLTKTGWGVQAYRLSEEAWGSDEARAWLTSRGAVNIQTQDDGLGVPWRSLADGQRGLAVASRRCLGTFTGYENTGYDLKAGETLLTKDVIAVGEYTHPVRGWKLDVTRQRMDKWVLAFRRMRENGVIVPFTKDHSPHAVDKLGEIVDLMRDGDVLRGIHKVPDLETEELVKKVNTTSLELEPEFADGKGRKYGEAITANSLVLHPVFPGQEGFQKIAASLQSGRLEHLFSDERTPTMKEHIAALRKLLSLADTVSDEDVLKKANEHFSTMDASLKTQATKISDLEGQIKTLSTKTANADDKTIAPEVAELLADQVDSEVDGMVKAGLVQPEVAKELKLHLLGDGTPDTYMLSRVGNASNGKRTQTRALALLGVIKRISPVKMGVQSGRQRVDMSTDDAAPAHDPAVTKSMSDLAYGPKA